MFYFVFCVVIVLLAFGLSSSHCDVWFVVGLFDVVLFVVLLYRFICAEAI